MARFISTRMIELGQIRWRICVCKCVGLFAVRYTAWEQAFNDKLLDLTLNLLAILIHINATSLNTIL